MKKFATIVILSLIMTACVTPAEAKTLVKNNSFSQPAKAEITIPIFTEEASIFSILMQNSTRELTMLEAEIKIREDLLEQERLASKTLEQNLSDLQVAIKNTEQYVGKTWYVFSGSSPRGWDCSGMITWTFAHMGFDLYHSATAQMTDYGKEVTEPKYGDLVGFKHSPSSKRYYHIGIYVSEDLMLHSGGKRGDKTELRSISGWAKDNGNSSIYYSRIVETN